MKTHIKIFTDFNLESPIKFFKKDSNSALEQDQKLKANNKEKEQTKHTFYFHEQCK